MTDELFYRPSFSKHLFSLARSNYFRRYLDSDDRAFLEYVRRHGSANGNLPSNGTVLLEELEFWHLPYSIAPGIERRIGKRPRAGETDEERDRRQARSNKWRAQRIIRENEKAIAAAELERERREHAAAQQTRKRREMLTDAEWTLAAPKHARPFGKTIGRWHVPQWKIEQNATAKRNRLATKHHENKARLAKEQKRAEHQAIDAARKRAAAERAIVEARETVKRAEAIERINSMIQAGYPSTDHLMKAILTLTYGTAPAGFVWTNAHLMRSLGITDEDLLNRCLAALIKQGRLRRVKDPAA